MFSFWIKIFFFKLINQCCFTNAILSSSIFVHIWFFSLFFIKNQFICFYLLHLHIYLKQGLATTCQPPFSLREINLFTILKISWESKPNLNIAIPSFKKIKASNSKRVLILCFVVADVRLLSADHNCGLIKKEIFSKKYVWRLISKWSGNQMNFIFGQFFIFWILSNPSVNS